MWAFYRDFRAVNRSIGATTFSVLFNLYLVPGHSVTRRSSRNGRTSSSREFESKTIQSNRTLALIPFSLDILPYYYLPQIAGRRTAKTLIGQWPLRRTRARMQRVATFPPSLCLSLSLSLSLPLSLFLSLS